MLVHWANAFTFLRVIELVRSNGGALAGFLPFLQGPVFDLSITVLCADACVVLNGSTSLSALHCENMATVHGRLLMGDGEVRPGFHHVILVLNVVPGLVTACLGQPSPEKFFLILLLLVAR